MSDVVVLIYVAIIVVVIAGFWRVFTKAGEAGWKSIIPIWNILVLLRIIGRPWWWLIFLLIPLVNLVISLLVSLDVAKSFGKGNGFGVGLWLLTLIFYPILGFVSATYRGGTGFAAATV